MLNTLQPKTRKVLTEFAIASFECGKLGSAEPERIVMLQRSQKALEDLEQHLRELETKAALGEHLATLLESLKASYSAVLQGIPGGISRQQH
jgi:hypothetical protein